MNDDLMARRLVRLLDTAADDLPAHIQSRLAVARENALDRYDALMRDMPARPRPSSPGIRRFTERLQESFWVRIAATVVPAVLLVLAALVGSYYNQERTAIQQAEAYTDMLTAEVPLSAYTDNGFAAHLRSGYMQTSHTPSSR